MSGIRPSTPTTPTSTSGNPSTPRTGTWRHPRLEEIERRKNLSSFTDKNVKNISYNIGGLAALWLVGRTVWTSYPFLIESVQLLHNDLAVQLLDYSAFVSHWIIYRGIQLLLTYNILMALQPLFRPKDDISDIPLTPAQRKLLGLPPSSKPPTPGSEYITPPRYARASTPLSGSPSSKKTPLSGSPASGIYGGPSFSPNASPLLQKAMGAAGFAGPRRSSYGSPSPLGASTMNVVEDPSTPSPTGPKLKGASVGLNNRWLYEKGRTNSGSSRLYT